MSRFATERWMEFMGDSPEGLFVVIDEQVSKPRGQLRSLALLTDLGLSHVTYNQTWHTDLELVPYSYHKLAPGRAANLLAEHGHLVQVVSQATIDHSTFHFTADLIRQALQPRGTRPLVVLVCDTQRLLLPGAMDGKSIFEDFGLIAKGVIPQSYQALFRRYRRQRHSPIRQHLTENVYFHRLAAELATAGWTEFDSLADLFRLNKPTYPMTPLVESILAYFLDNYERREAVEYDKGPPFIREEMRSWLEWGEAGAVANALWYGMAVFDFNMDKLMHWKGAQK